MNKAYKFRLYPTEKQKEYGNYKKGHIIINGFKITIENPKGSYRRGIDSNGKEWKIKMNNDYGYFLNSMGYDGDHIDVFLGNDFESKKIFVVDQKIKGKFDESKVMLGFNSKEEAKKAYLSNYEKDWKGFHKITEVDEETFKKWLYDGKKQRKPFYQYKDIKKVKIMTESILKKIIKESINKILIKEARESTISTNKLIKKLYTVAQNYKRLYKDNDWTYLRALMNDLANVPGVRDFNYGGGKYHQNGKEFGESAYKLYTVEIETEFDTIIKGEVYCNFAGTIDDPWSRYDMTVNFWRDSGISESKKYNINEDMYKSIEIKSPKLRRLLKKEGLDDIYLLRCNGAFYVCSNNLDLDNALQQIGNEICVYAFNHQTPEQWLDDIKYIVNKANDYL